MTVARPASPERLRALLNTAPADASIESILPTPASDWAITRELARFLALLLEQQRPESVLEFGAGASSLLLARALRLAGGGRLTSVEHKPEHARAAWAEVARVQGVDAELVESPLRPRLRGWRTRWEYTAAPPRLAERGPFGLVFIDAPPRRYRRDGSFAAAHPHLSHGALIVLDDAGRKDERRSLDRWLNAYPDVKLLLHDRQFGGKGVAVLARC